MMGGGHNKDKKFINKVYKQILSGKCRLHVVDDKFERRPTRWILLRGFISCWKVICMVCTTKYVAVQLAVMK